MPTFPCFGVRMANELSPNGAKTDPGFTRTIVDPSGAVWFVREMHAPSYDRRGAASLVFVSDEVMRRVRDYPPDWRSLTDHELYAVSLRR